MVNTDRRAPNRARVKERYSGVETALAPTAADVSRAAQQAVKASAATQAASLPANGKEITLDLVAGESSHVHGLGRKPSGANQLRVPNQAVFNVVSFDKYEIKVSCFADGKAKLWVY